ncbi:helix-turn-helix domain-containing protein [Nocardiopsis alborubida]|uniref:Helix-turn-helix domain-containing protein n=1 Tax=Nocardiopsis alborubida TaxID=146802 RepID=A0A7X6RTH2_9ACTN|nr:helix-turn-helix transcriptional regulator [Nocardiopsis alborubida]NKZ02086.1 helix-turn-helix domain-containing protein [Nocardiopsis alborubida]
MAKRKTRPHAKEWGSELKILRTKVNKTQKSVADGVRCSDTLICGFEKGTHWPSRDMAADLDKALKGSGALVSLWDRLNSKRSYPDWARDLVKAETRAVLMRQFETTVIPGLVQTEAYARTLIRANNSLGPVRDADELVSGRMDRQVLWGREDPPRMILILNEAVLMCCIGGPEVMSGQLTRLVEMVEKEVIRVHIIPMKTRRPSFTMGFTLLSFSGDADALYVEDALAGRMVNEEAEVSRMDRLFSDLLGVSLSPEESLKLLYLHRRKHEDDSQD